MRNVFGDGDEGVQLRLDLFRPRKTQVEQLDGRNFLGKDETAQFDGTPVEQVLFHHVSLSPNTVFVGCPGKPREEAPGRSPGKKPREAPGRSPGKKPREEDPGSPGKPGKPPEAPGPSTEFRIDGRPRFSLTAAAASAEGTIALEHSPERRCRPAPFIESRGEGAQMPVDPRLRP